MSCIEQEILSELQTKKHFVRVEWIKDYLAQANDLLDKVDCQVYSNYFTFTPKDVKVKVDAYMSKLANQEKLSKYKRKKKTREVTEYIAMQDSTLKDIANELSEHVVKHNRKYKEDKKSTEQAILFDVMLPIGYERKTAIQKASIINDIIKRLTPESDYETKVPWIACVEQRGKHKNSYYVKILIIPRTFWREGKEKTVKYVKKDVYRAANGAFATKDTENAVLVKRKGDPFKKRVYLSVSKHEFYKTNGGRYWEIKKQRTTAWKISIYLVLVKYFDKLNDKLLSKLQFLRKVQGKYRLIRDDDTQSSSNKYKYRRYMLINDWIELINVLHTFKKLKLSDDEANAKKKSLQASKERIDLFELTVQQEIKTILKTHENELEKLPEAIRNALKIENFA